MKRMGDVLPPPRSVFLTMLEQSLAWQHYGGSMRKWVDCAETGYRRFPFMVMVHAYSGHFFSTCDTGERWDVPMGKTLLVPAGIRHTFGAAVPGFLCHARIQFTLFGGADLFHFFTPPPVVDGQTSRIIGQTITRLHEIVVAYPMALADQIRWAIRLREIFEHLLWRVLQQAHLDDRALLRLGETERLQPALQWIEHNLHRTITRTELASAVALSETRFHYVFKETMGISPMAYVKETRLRRGQILLATSQRSVSEIAVMVGYGSMFQFSRQFKQAFQLSPSQYRQQTRQWFA